MSSLYAPQTKKELVKNHLISDKVQMTEFDWRKAY